MKCSGNDVRPAHRDSRRQIGIGAENPAAFRTFRRGIEMDDLTPRMNAGIGAACAGDLDRFVGDERQRGFDRLHRRCVAQPLPAAEIGAVVFDAERDAHGWSSSFENVKDSVSVSRERDERRDL